MDAIKIDFSNLHESRNVTLEAFQQIFWLYYPKN